jgi:hypothetical protein
MTRCPPRRHVVGFHASSKPIPFSKYLWYEELWLHMAMAWALLLTMNGRQSG